MNLSLVDFKNYHLRTAGSAVLQLVLLCFPFYRRDLNEER